MKRDAIVIHEATGNVHLDIDPLPLEDMGGGLIDCGDLNAIHLVTSAEMASTDDHRDYVVVWSDDRSSPMFKCPMHDTEDLISLGHAIPIEGQEELDECSELVCSDCMPC